MSHFYRKIEKQDRYLKLKERIEQHWPNAYGFLKNELNQEESTNDNKATDGSKESSSSTFLKVEQMPLFPGCEQMGKYSKEKKRSADRNLLNFIYSTVKYPSIARENGVEGMVIIEFTVSEHGTILDSKIFKNPEQNISNEGLRVVNKMNEYPFRWKPGVQLGKNVRVKFNLPIKFKLT